MLLGTGRQLLLVNGDMQRISENLYRFEDTCNVYVIRNGTQAVLIDFGDGEVLAELAAIGVTRVSAILMTHHHRDQGEGLPRAVKPGTPVWVPQTEQDLFQNIDVHWQGREIYNNYNVRQDRFSLLESIPVAGTLGDYAVREFGGYGFTVVPTPGHTPGSITLLSDIDGQRVAFTGDLIAAPGKVWSLAATQWTYNGGEGVAASIPSLLDVQARAPDLLLPSHGEPMRDVNRAIELLVERLRELLVYRRHNARLVLFLRDPYERITPHLLRNLTSVANSYVLLSESGKALIIDYGYDFVTGLPAGTDRASRRPWLYSLPKLKELYGVTEIQVALATHYHDDHIAGFNLLREVEGAQIWAAENYADILQNPSRYDLPCLWYDPVKVDRVLPLQQPIQWQEYELTLYELPGHTLYAVAISFEVDGKRVLGTGDQYQGNDGELWNYVYKNKFHLSNYLRTAELFRQLHPDVIISGHWDPLWVHEGYFERLSELGHVLADLHQSLLPPETAQFDAEGFGMAIQPYQVEARGGECIEFEVQVRNPLPSDQEVSVKMIVPKNWIVQEEEQTARLPYNEPHTLKFHITPPGTLRARRSRIAAYLTIGGRHLGQQAEALVTVTPGVEP